MVENNKPQMRRFLVTDDETVYATAPSAEDAPIVYATSVTSANYIRHCDADLTKTYTIEFDMTYKNEPITVEITGVSGHSFQKGFKVSLTPKIEE